MVNSDKTFLKKIISNISDSWGGDLMEYDFDQSIWKSPPLEDAVSKNITQMKFPQTSFVDTMYEPGERAIYTVACVDARGFTSNYGAQFEVYYDKFKNVLHKKLISREGAPKSYPNIYFNEDIKPLSSQ